MKNILIDENGDYGLECTNAVWASDQMHQDYHTAKVPLADADFLLEDEKFTHMLLPNFQFGSKFEKK